MRLIMLEKQIPLAALMLSILLGLAACGDSEAPKAENSKENVVETITTAEPQTDIAVVEEEVEQMEEPVNALAGAVVAAIEPVVETVTAEAAQQLTTEIAEASQRKQHMVLAGATSFTPKVLFTNPGDEICWANMTAHDSQSIEGLIPEGARPWHIALGRNGCVRLTVEGVYIYKCNPHYPLGMAGAIIVGRASNIEQIEANATGRAKGVVIKVKRALEQ
jgi:pseudoazurin